MRACPRALALFAALLVAGPAAAQGPDAPADETLVVGVYAPNMYFANSLERSQYADQLAAGLGRITGRTFRGRGFSTQGEFDNQVAAGQVHFALIDAQHQLERGYEALAQGTANGQPTRPMVLVAASGGSVADLQGKRLARVQLGRGDEAFIVNHLLQSQVDPDFFGEARTVRDVQGALSLVKLGKADAAFAYKGIEPGIFESRPVPLPVFVRTAEVPSAVEQKVRQAVLGLAVPSKVVQGFSAYRADIHKGLQAALRSKPHGPVNKPVLSRGGDDLPPVPAGLVVGETPPTLPPVADELTAIDPPPDLY